MATATKPRKFAKRSKTAKQPKTVDKAEAKAESKILAKADVKKTDEVVSGSDAIRQTLKSGTTRPAEVIAVEKEKFGLDVSLSLVAGIRGKEGYSKKRRKKRAAKKATSEVTNGHSYDVSLASLIAAKKLAESLGGVEEARLALNALAKLG